MFGEKIFLKSLIEDYNLIGLVRDKLKFYNQTEIENFTLKKAIKLVSNSEVQFIKDIANSIDPKMLYLCHNDCYYMNTMFNIKTKNLIFIDFEYAAMNPWGADIANIANESVFEYGVSEYPFFSYNYSNYPSNDNIKEMIKTLYMFWYNKDVRFSIENVTEFKKNYNDNKELIDSIPLVNMQNNYLMIKKAAVLNAYFYLLWAMWDLKYIFFFFSLVKNYIEMMNSIWTMFCLQGKDVTYTYGQNIHYKLFFLNMLYLNLFKG